MRRILDLLPKTGAELACYVAAWVILDVMLWDVGRRLHRPSPFLRPWEASDPHTQSHREPPSPFGPQPHSFWCRRSWHKGDIAWQWYDESLQSAFPETRAATPRPPYGVDGTWELGATAIWEMP